MQSGTLRQRFTLYEKRVVGENSFGDDLTDLTPIAEFSGSIIQLVGRELAAQQQRHAEARFKLTCRFPQSFVVKREYVIRWHDSLRERFYNIVDAEDSDGRRQQMVMYLSEYTE